MKIKLCVIILNYKTYDLTISYINDLLNQKKIELSLVIVDNDSKNHSYEKISQYFKYYNQVEVIKSKYNGGYAYGNNYGLNHIKNKDFDYIVISNNDVKLEDDLLFFKLYKQYIILPSPALISPLQITDGNILPSAWKLPTIWYDIFTNVPILNRFIVKYNRYNFFQHDAFVAVDVLPGSFLFFKKEIIFNIGLLDENTFLYGEERILAYKIKQHKLQNYLIPCLSYEHISSGTISLEIKKAVMLKMVHTSIVYYHEKYLKTSSFLITILMLLHKLVRKYYCEKK